MTTGVELGILAYDMWGSKGVPVFPCSIDKRPLCKWSTAASTDRSEILSMFAHSGDRAELVGGAMGEEAGLFAVDFDLYKPGGKAQEYMDILTGAGCLPKTRVHKTKSGGTHHIFFNPEVGPVPRNSVPYDSVEIRGEGGYIILPPAGGYSVISDGTVEAPQELVDRIERGRKAFNSSSVTVLKRKIIEGTSFHEAANLLAAKLTGSGKTPEQVAEVVMGALRASVAADPSHHRHSRWAKIVSGEDGELGRVLSSAYSKYSQQRGHDTLEAVYTGVGKREPSPFFKTHEDVTYSGDPLGTSSDTGGSKPLPVVPPTPEATDEFPFKRSYEASKVNDEEDKNFLVFPLIMESDVIVLSAEPKAGKTLLTMNLALHMSAGIPVGDLVPLDKNGKTAKIPVVYFALEGQGAIRKRVKAWCEFQRKRGNTVEEGDLHMYIVEQPVNLADDEAKQVIVDKLVLAELYFKKLGWGEIGLVVFDTLTKSMPGKDQNSVEDTSAVFNTVDLMRESNLNAAVLFVHHNAKAGKGPRGSGNIQAEPDTVLSVEKLKPVVVDDAQVDCYQLSVYMARAVDDAQKYLFKAHVVDIGENRQGIVENAPVVEIMDDYSVAPSTGEASMQKQVEVAKGKFYAALYRILSETNEMNMTMQMLHRKIANSGDAAGAYYAQHVNGGSQEQVRNAWKVLLSSDTVPAALSGVDFKLKDDIVYMQLQLGTGT